MEDNVIKFMYFGHNYPNMFIEKVWKDNKRIGKHLQEKFSDMYSRHGTKTFFSWFMELDYNNKKILIKYINENYEER